MKKLFVASLIASGLGRLFAAEGTPGTPPKPDETKPGETPPPDPAKPAAEPMNDNVKSVFEAVAKLSDEDMEKFNAQLKTWLKSKGKAMEGGASPEEAAKIANLETELAALKLKAAQDVDRLTADVTAIKHKLSAGADPVSLHPNKTGGEPDKQEKPKPRGLAARVNEATQARENSSKK